MKKTVFLFILLFIGCQSETPKSKLNPKITEPRISTKPLISKVGVTIEERFNPPLNYQRVEAEKNSFQDYLRNLSLKPVGSKVLYHNGATKSNNNVYEAVVDLPIGTKNLHQCADAVMRLQAEYLWNNKMYDQIHFNFTNGFRVDYSEWMKGKRIKVNGNKTSWVDKTSPSNTYKDFWNYLEIIFTLLPVDIQKAEIGDVLIQGGHPGHAVIIVDKATHKTTGKNVYLLAQSYMPAQELQVLKNPENEDMNPWMELNEGTIRTSEWAFESGDLRRFEE